MEKQLGPWDSEADTPVPGFLLKTHLFMEQARLRMSESPLLLKQPTKTTLTQLHFNRLKKPKKESMLARNHTQLDLAIPNPHDNTSRESTKKVSILHRTIRCDFKSEEPKSNAKTKMKPKQFLLELLNHRRRHEIARPSPLGKLTRERKVETRGLRQFNLFR